MLSAGMGGLSVRLPYRANPRYLLLRAAVRLHWLRALCQGLLSLHAVGFRSGPISRMMGRIAMDCMTQKKVPMHALQTPCRSGGRTLDTALPKAALDAYPQTAPYEHSPGLYSCLVSCYTCSTPSLCQPFGRGWCVDVRV